MYTFIEIFPNANRVHPPMQRRVETNKRIFDLAMKKAELQPDEARYIGDQYECESV